MIRKKGGGEPYREFPKLKWVKPQITRLRTWWDKPFAATDHVYVGDMCIYCDAACDEPGDVCPERRGR